MPGSATDLLEALRAVAAALLIGFLVGAERESTQSAKHPGVRDFILIALIGAVCALLDAPWLTAAALFSVTVLLVVYRHQALERGGITTEMAALATFCLAFMTAKPHFPLGGKLAIGLTIVMVASLEAKQALHKLVRETLTETEFQDTVRFLALIFVIYPLLPAGEFGPYGFLAPRTIWLFVIVVSSISYLGYFLEKFLGPRKGLRFAGVLGGLASTTAATAEFARHAAREPENLDFFWHAGVMANAMQFPRVLVILYAVNPELANASLPPLLVMCLSGFLMAWLVERVSGGHSEPRPMALGNPFRLAPALLFGAGFTMVLFLTKAAEARLGTGGVQWTSALSGSFSVDAVAVSLSDLLNHGRTSLAVAQLGTFLALLVNAAVKTAIAGYSGSLAFAWRMASGFVVMLGAGALAWWLGLRF